MTDSPLSVSEVARRAGVSEATVLGWCASGELRAWDASRGRGPKRRWRVEPADFEAFKLARSNQKAAKPVRRRKLPNVPQYV